MIVATGYRCCEDRATDTIGHLISEGCGSHDYGVEE